MVKAQLNSIPAYVAHLASLDPAMPTVSQLTKRLRTGPMGTRIQLPLHCKVCRDLPARTCPIVVHQLPALNGWLYGLGCELREVAPGRLALLSLQHDEARWGSPTRMVAVVLLHCLLTRHRCLQAAEGLRHLLPFYRKVFCDAIRNSSSLTSLQLSKCELNGLTVRSLVAAVTSTDLLEELSLEFCNCPGRVQAAENALVSYIAKTKSLRSLSVVDVALFRDDKALIESLEKNASIVKLTVGSQVLLPKQEEAFCHFVACNTRILELGLVRSVRDSAVKLDNVFRAIAENSKLRKLSVCRFNLDLVTATLCFEAVARSAVLQEVEFPACTWRAPCKPEEPARQQAVRAIADKLGSDLRIGPLVMALETTTSLRKLALHVGFTDWEMRRLLNAVRSCASLESIIFYSLTTTSMEPFYRALAETGTTEKVAFHSVHMPTSDFVSCLGRCGDVMRMGTYSFFAFSPEALRKISTDLLLHDHITALHLQHYCIEDIGPEDASTVATYLSSTTALKDIFLSFFGISEASSRTLIEGIAKNCTLEKLGMDGWFVSIEDIDVLCKWLAASKRVYQFVYLCDHYPTSEALVVGLNKVLVDSYTLTYLKVKEYRTTFYSVQAARNLVRRNLSLVECAVQFVLGSTHKRAAEAFETVSYHPQVAYKVGEAASLHPADVKQKLKESWRRVHLNYFQLTGIVQEELVCNERWDGQMQINELGHDALLHVCSFLRVSDVLDEARKKARKRKRRGW